MHQLRIATVIAYFIVQKSQNRTDDSPVGATTFTSCGFHAPPDKECNILAESLDITYIN